jgi:DNA-binding transcriptional LysR family regulator
MVELILEEASSVDIVRALEAREMDVGIVRLPLLEVTNVETRVIDRDELRAAVPTSSRFARAGRVALEALAAEPFVFQSRVSVLHAIALMACHEAGFTPIIAQEATQQSAILSLVRSGLGVALVPGRAASAVPQGVQLVPLERPVPIESGIALPIHRASPQAQRFAALADSASLSTECNLILDQ